MMCRNVRGLLSAYTDGELSPADACGVKSHLDRCEACAREHTVLRRLVSITSSIPMEEVPASLHEQIIMRLAYADAPSAAPARRSGRSPLPRTWAWAAFTVTAAAILGGVLHNRPERVARVPLSIPAVDAPQSESRVDAAPSLPKADQEQPEAAPATPAPVTATATTGHIGYDEAEVLAPEPDAAAPKPQPVVRKLVPERVASGPVEAPGDRPQPVPVPTIGRPATEVRASEPSDIHPNAAMAKEGLMAMPGDPLINGVGPVVPTDPVMPLDKDPTRMAGMAVEVETPGEEDEGLRSFRMFLQENSRTVPQPPTVRPRERGGRKSL